MKGINFIAMIAVTLLTYGCASMSEDECKSGEWKSVGIRDGSQGREMSKFYSYKKACAEYKVTPNLVQYKEGRNEGLKSFCYTQGQNVGAAGNHKGAHALCNSRTLTNSYGNGYTVGVKSYCTYDRGFERGNAGSTSNIAVCPKSTHNNFKSGYKAGLKSYCKVNNAFSVTIAGNSFNHGNCSQKRKAKIKKAMKDGKEYLRHKKDVTTMKKKIKQAEKGLDNPKLPSIERFAIERSIRKLDREVFRTEETMNRISTKYE